MVACWPLFRFSSWYRHKPTYYSVLRTKKKTSLHKPSDYLFFLSLCRNDSGRIVSDRHETKKKRSPNFAPFFFFRPRTYALFARFTSSVRVEIAPPTNRCRSLKSVGCSLCSLVVFITCCLTFPKTVTIRQLFSKNWFHATTLGTFYDRCFLALAAVKRLRPENISSL